VNTPPINLFSAHDIHNPETRERILSSGIPLTSSDDKNVVRLNSPRLSFEEQLKFNRVGLDGLNVHGTVGDSINDPRVFNTLLKEIDTFFQQRCPGPGCVPVSLTPGELYIIGKTGGEIPKPSKKLAKELWGDFVDHLKKSTKGKFLRKHLHFKKSLVHGITATILEAWFDPETRQKPIKNDPLRRVPEVRVVPTSEMIGFAICSDGVLRTHEAGKAVEDMVSLFDQRRSFEQAMETFRQCRAKNKDDRSGVLVWFLPPQSTEGDADTNSTGSYPDTERDGEPLQKKAKVD